MMHRSIIRRLTRPVPLLLASAALVAGTAEAQGRANARRVMVAFEPGSATKDGYADAQLEIRYWFQSCDEGIGLVAEREKHAHIVSAPHRYWYQGQLRTVPPHIAAPTLSANPSIRGTARGNGVQRETSVTAAPESNCWNLGTIVAKKSELFPPGATREQQDRAIAGLGFHVSGRLSVLTNAEVHRHFAAVVAEERRLAMEAKQAADRKAAAEKRRVDSAAAAAEQRERVARASAARPSGGDAAGGAASRTGAGRNSGGKAAPTGAPAAPPPAPTRPVTRADGRYTSADSANAIAWARQQNADYEAEKARQAKAEQEQRDRNAQAAAAIREANAEAKKKADEETLRGMGELVGMIGQAMADRNASKEKDRIAKQEAANRAREAMLARVRALPSCESVRPSHTVSYDAQRGDLAGAGACRTNSQQAAVRYWMELPDAEDVAVALTTLEATGVQQATVSDAAGRVLLRLAPSVKWSYSRVSLPAGRYSIQVEGLPAPSGTYALSVRRSARYVTTADGRRSVALRQLTTCTDLIGVLDTLYPGESRVLSSRYAGNCASIGPIPEVRFLLALTEAETVEIEADPVATRDVSAGTMAVYRVGIDTAVVSDYEFGRGGIAKIKRRLDPGLYEVSLNLFVKNELAPTGTQATVTIKGKRGGRAAGGMRVPTRTNQLVPGVNARVTEVRFASGTPRAAAAPARRGAAPAAKRVYATRFRNDRDSVAMEVTFALPAGHAGGRVPLACTVAGPYGAPLHTVIGYLEAAPGVTEVTWKPEAFRPNTVVDTAKWEPGVHRVFCGHDNGTVRSLPIVARDSFTVEYAYPGVGVAYWHRPGRITITAVDSGTPAAAAGLRVGDVITAVNGTPTAGLSHAAFGERMHGELGKPLHLTVSRAGATRPVEARMTRVSVITPSVLPDAEALAAQPAPPSAGAVTVRPGPVSFHNPRFFADTSWYGELPNPVHATRFSRTTPFIMMELTATKPPTSGEAVLDVSCARFTDKGAPSGEPDGFPIRLPRTAMDGERLIVLRQEKPYDGDFPRGKFNVVCSAGGVVIARAGFEVF